MNRGLSKLVLHALCLYLCACPPVIGDVWFGLWRGEHWAWVAGHDLADQGRFFATTDFGYDPTRPDAFKNTLTRGQLTAKAPPGSSRLFRLPWLSSNQRTLFGLSFDAPFTGLKVPPERPVRFNRIQILWGGHAPLPDSWNAFILTEDGRTVMLPVDRARKLYPWDTTTVDVEPTTISRLYVGKKGVEDGVDQVVEVIGLRVLVAEQKLLTNNLAVFQPDCYRVQYDPRRPGTISALVVAAPYFSEPGSLSTQWWFDPLFSSLSPCLFFQDKALLAEPMPVPVSERSTPEGDFLEYTLTFRLPEGGLAYRMPVKASFHPRIRDGIVIELARPESLPPGVTMGIRMDGATALFDRCVPAGSNVTVAAAAPLTWDTPAGDVGLALRGASEWRIRRVEGQGMQFSAQAAGPLTLSLSLPTGPQSKVPLSPVPGYTAPARQGREGYAPFLPEDLELMETVECGDPKDPHPFFDITTDPVVKKNPAYFQHLTISGRRQAPLIMTPEKGAVPITTVAGKSCRAIGSEYGAFFRYELTSSFERDVFYLLVVEHAFDKTRRGTLDLYDGHSWGPVQSGVDTGASPGEPRYRKESFVFRYPHVPNPRPAEVLRKPFSIWFSNCWQWQGWLKADGPAVSRLELYRIKRMPRLPDLQALLPAPEQRRHVDAYSQVFSPQVFEEDLPLTGIDSLWVNNAPCQLLSGMTWRSARLEDGIFHPGTLNGYEWVLARAEQHGVAIKTYFSQLVKMGFTDPDRVSFAGITDEGDGATYNWDDVPLSPTRDELGVLSKALDHALSRLARYRSLQAVCLADSYWNPFSYRNLRDFSAETGLPVPAIPVQSFEMENANILLNCPEATIKAWTEWSCRKRYAFNDWLLKQVRRHRKDLAVMMNAKWVRAYMDLYFYNAPDKPLSREQCARKGIRDYGDYLRFCGYDPALYKGKNGFQFQIHAGYPANSLLANNRLTDSGEPGRRAPAFWHEPWAQTLIEGFTGGLNVSLPLCYEEVSKPLTGGHCAFFFKNGEEYKQAMIEALLANARTVDLESYNLPWRGRLQEVRAFAVPFRLLPFTPPERFDGALDDPSGKVVIRKHADRYAVINPSPQAVRIALDFPTQGRRMVDLSNGLRETLPTVETHGRSRVELAMEPWSVRVLTAGE